MAPDIATFAAVQLDIPVDRRNAHRGQLHEFASTNELLRAPVVAQGLLDQGPFFMAELRSLARAPSPGHGVLVRLLMAVVAVVRGRVAIALPADGRCRAAQRPTDRSKAVPLLNHVAHGVSFALGELAIFHCLRPLLAG